MPIWRYLYFPVLCGPVGLFVSARHVLTKPLSQFVDKDSCFFTRVKSAAGALEQDYEAGHIPGMDIMAAQDSITVRTSCSLICFARPLFPMVSN